jgi:hypothetical protein
MQPFGARHFDSRDGSRACVALQDQRVHGTTTVPKEVFLNQQIANRPVSLGRLSRELFWPFKTLSWSPVRTPDGTTELTFSVQLRAESKQLAVRWMILSGCFLVAAGMASTVLLMLGGISGIVGMGLLFVDRRIPKPKAEPTVAANPESTCHDTPPGSESSPGDPR